MRKNWTEMIALLLVAALLTMGFSGCAPASEPVGPGPGVDEPVDPIEPTPPEPPALELTVFGDSTYPGDAFGVEIKNSGDELPVVSFTLDEDTYEVPVFRDGERVLALVPVKLRATTPIQGVVSASRERGAVAQATAEITVMTKEFPEVQQFVETDEMREIKEGEKEPIDGERTAAALSNPSADRLFEGRFDLPLEGRITTEFGQQRYRNGEYYYTHTGIDLGARQGREVAAPNSGVVVLAEKLDVGGNVIIIDHGFHIFSYYMHLSEFKVEVGDRVAKGDVIGLVGSTGYLTGPHLHYALSVDDYPIDPYFFNDQDPMELFS